MRHNSLAGGVTAVTAWVMSLVVIGLLVFLQLVSCEYSGPDEKFWNNPLESNGWFFYKVFASSNETPQDGPTGVGSFCNPGLGGAVGPNMELVFPDMCLGSAIRVVSMDRNISTLAGSLTETGYIDGPGPNARFNAKQSGDQKANSIVRANGEYYMTDTLNNVVRRIKDNGDTFTYISNSSRFDGRPLVDPRGISPVITSIGATNLFIADTGNSRILYTPLGTNEAQLYLNRDQVQCTSLTVSQSGDDLYQMLNTSSLEVTNIRSGLTWEVGTDTEHYYLNSLVPYNNDTELLFVGAEPGIYSFDITEPPTSLQIPSLKIEWPYASDWPQSLVVRDNVSWYVVGNQNVYIIAKERVYPTFPDVDPHAGRYHGIAAFPRDALPYNDSCLMSQLYYWVRMDAKIAYETDDYYTQFVPLNDPNMSFLGDVNVSGMCSNITARKSKDGTIEIVDFWGPKEWSQWRTQDALATSPWYWTRLFLEGLRKNGTDLGNFCFFNCTGNCEDATADPTMCIDYKKPPSCDDVCKGAIAASVVMGATGVVLLVLILVSPANLFTALVMVPII